MADECLTRSMQAGHERLAILAAQTYPNTDLERWKNTCLANLLTALCGAGIDILIMTSPGGSTGELTVMTEKQRN